MVVTFLTTFSLLTPFPHSVTSPLPLVFFWDHPNQLLALELLSRDLFLGRPSQDSHLPATSDKAKWGNSSNSVTGFFLCGLNVYIYETCPKQRPTWQAHACVKYDNTSTILLLTEQKLDKYQPPS